MSFYEKGEDIILIHEMDSETFTYSDLKDILRFHKVKMSEFADFFDLAPDSSRRIAMINYKDRLETLKKDKKENKDLIRKYEENPDDYKFMGRKFYHMFLGYARVQLPSIEEYDVQIRKSDPDHPIINAIAARTKKK